MDEKLKKSNRKKKIKINARRISIIIAFMIAIIVMCVIIVNSKKTEKYAASKTSSDIEDLMEEENKSENEIIAEIEAAEQTDDTSWDEEAEETKVDMEEEKKDQNNKPTYYIKINYTANCVTIYKKDSSGNYTVPVKAMVCSTGKATPTSGVYKMSDKYRWHMLNGGVYGQYCSRITGHILFHSVPYLTNSPDALEYWAYDKLGTKASAGCIRLTVEDAKWIHGNCPSGTYVEFYSSSNPGPLGKPSAQKISWNEACRDWDPTDPDSRNPWHTYVPPKEEPKVEEPETKPEEQKPEIIPEVKPQEPNTNTEVNTNTENNTITEEDNKNEVENTTTNTIEENTNIEENETIENEVNQTDI